jgi:hypothetical protein
MSDLSRLTKTQRAVVREIQRANQATRVTAAEIAQAVGGKRKRPMTANAVHVIVTQAGYRDPAATAGIRSASGPGGGYWWEAR